MNLQFVTLKMGTAEVNLTLGQACQESRKIFSAALTADTAASTLQLPQLTNLQ